MDAAELFRAEASNDRVMLIARTALAQRGARDECSVYLAALELALQVEPPPFGTATYADLYRGASSDPLWMAVSLITNAEREGDGAKRLWSLSACSSDKKKQDLLKVHAVDESRHALIYLRLLDLTFPGMTESGFRGELNKLSPLYTMNAHLAAVEGSPYAKEPTLDDYLQMNIAEIRTTIHHLMHRIALADHAPSENRERITMIQNSLLRDELAHVAYTAMLIEQIAQEVGKHRVFALCRQRLRDFNQITNEELGQHAFDCSRDCCSRHANCRPKIAGSAIFGDGPL